MIKITLNALAAGAMISLAAHPAFAADALLPGPIWIGQAAGGQGGSTGTGAGAGAGTGNGVGGTNGAAAGNGPGAGAGNVGGVGAPGGGTDAGGAGSGAGATAGGNGANGATGTNGNGTNNAGTTSTGTTNSGANNNGTNANGTNNNGANGNAGVGSNGANGNGGVGSSNSGASQSASGTSGSQGSLPLPGASSAPQVFNLSQTIQAGVQSSADVQTATRNVQIDAKRADEAAAAARPNVNASGQATRFDQKTVIPFGNMVIPVTGTHLEILQLNLTDRLDLTGQIAASTDQFRLQSLADTFILGQVRNARILRAQTIYFNTLRAQHQVDVANAELVDAQRQLTDATNLNTAGVGQRIDVYRAQTQVATAEQDVATAENNYGVALESFNDLVGRPLNAPVILQDAPGVTIALPVTDFSQVGAPDIKAAPPLPNAPGEVAAININNALQYANQQRPEILQAQVNVRVAQTGIKLARAGQEPTFSLAAAGDYYPDTNFQFPRKRTAQITANLNIPLYDSGITRDRVQESRLSTQNAQTSLASTRSDVALDVRQSYLNLATAARQIGAANAALQSAIAARQLAELRYQGQVGLYLEVTDAQSALVQAENNQVDAVYNYLVARAQFQNAIGAPQTR